MSKVDFWKYVKEMAEENNCSADGEDCNSRECPMEKYCISESSMEEDFETAKRLIQEHKANE